MAETYHLQAENRDVTGKQVRALRAVGKVPAVLYGNNVKPQSLLLVRGELEKVYRQAGATSIVEVGLADGKHNALIHAVQLHPVTGQLLHADLYQVRMDEKVKTTVPLVLESTAPAVRELDGVLLNNLSELDIEALPADLPHEITVSIEGLATFEDSITVADLKVPSGVAVLTEPETTVASVQPPKSEEQLEAELAEDVEAVTADDVESEGDEDAEGEEGEGDGDGENAEATDGDAEKKDEKS